ncbi:hypothetical protein [Blautia producta]|nr:hypothetical protein [Blautia coccoides]MDT4371847.1 hypothetical protein [Blautia coccoides]
MQKRSFMIPAYIKSYLFVIFILLVFEYVFHKVFIKIHPTYASGKKIERPPSYFGPFSKGEFVAWLVRSIGAPTWIFIFPNAVSTMHNNIVIGGFVVFFIVIPMILTIKIDGRNN